MSMRRARGGAKAMMAGRRLAGALGALLGLFVGLFVAVRADAGTLRYVDDDGLDGFNCTNAPYTKISDAIAASKAGDEIRVCPGTYVEQIVIPFQMTIRGEPFGSRRAVIKPTSLPTTLPSLDGGNPVTAAILDDGHLLRLSDIDIDLADNTVGACSPMLAGVYVRNGWAAIERLEVYNAIVNGRPDCDSGVGILVESGIKEILFGRPVYGKSRFIAKDLHFESFQKAGLVGIGPKTIVRLEGGEAAGALAGAGAAVPYGYELANGARAKLINAAARGARSLTAGKLAAGMLAFEAGKVTFRRDLLEDNDVGIMVVGDNARVKRNTFNGQHSDGVVFLGNSNLLASPDLHGASVTGCFVTGDHNVVKGGFIGGTPIGIWFQGGIGNAFYGINWGEVPLETRGVYGGLRDLTPADAAPFLTRCTGSLSCDDGNACTTDLCDPGTGACSHGVTNCDDVNVCTADSCDPVVGCLHAPVPGTCDDLSLCTSGDTCTAGACVGTPTVVAQVCALGNGTVCDGIEMCNPTTGLCAPGTPLTCNDTNDCTTDTCDPGTGCVYTAVSDGTPCSIGTCTAGVCG
jgi:hypothetical protein